MHVDDSVTSRVRGGHLSAAWPVGWPPQKRKRVAFLVDPKRYAYGVLLASPRKAFEPLRAKNKQTRGRLFLAGLTQ